MTAEHRDLVASLLEPLLDARGTAAGTTFDDLLSAAAADGRISPELARQLRFWQRTSVLEVADHVRTVLPAVLPVALAAVAAANAAGSQAVEAAEAAWRDRSADRDKRPAQEHDQVHDAQAVPSAPDEAREDVPGAASAEADDPSGPHLRRRLFVAGLTSTA